MLESEIQDEIIGGPNQIEAVMAEMEKREARFDDVASAADNQALLQSQKPIICAVRATIQ